MRLRSGEVVVADLGNEVRYLQAFGRRFFRNQPQAQLSEQALGAAVAAGTRLLFELIASRALDLETQCLAPPFIDCLDEAGMNEA